MGFWDQFWATVLGGLAVAAALAFLGWLFTRIRAGIRPRPAFRLSKHPSGLWSLERTARGTAYDIRVTLSLNGVRVKSPHQDLMNTRLERGAKTNIHTEGAQWTSATVTWTESPTYSASAWIEDAKASYDLVPERGDRPSLKKWLARLLS